MTREIKRELEDELANAEQHALENHIIRFKDKVGIWKLKKKHRGIEKGTKLAYVGEDEIKCETIYWGVEKEEIRVSWTGLAHVVGESYQ